jgi:hypothetical protein
VLCFCHVDLAPATTPQSKYLGSPDALDASVLCRRHRDCSKNKWRNTMPNKQDQDIEWGEPGQPVEGGVMPSEPAKPEPQVRRQKSKTRKSHRGRNKGSRT